MIIFIHVCSPEHTSKICTAHPCNLCHPAHRDLVCTGHMWLGVRRCTSGVLLSTKLVSNQLTGSAPTLYFWVGRNFWQKLTKAWNLPFVIMRLAVHLIVLSWCFDPESNCTCSFQMMLILRLKRHFCNNIRSYLIPHHHIIQPIQLSKLNPWKEMALWITNHGTKKGSIQEWGKGKPAEKGASAALPTN